MCVPTAWPDVALSEWRRLLIDDVMVRYRTLAGRDMTTLVRSEDVGEVLRNGKPMSAAVGNRVAARPLVDAFGEDAVRMGMLFTAPPGQAFEWSDYCVRSAARWLTQFRARVAREAERTGATSTGKVAFAGAAARARCRLHQALAKIKVDFAGCRLNRVVAGVMSMINNVRKSTDESPAGRALNREMLEIALLLLAPIIPGLSHEFWPAISGRSLDEASWPEVTPSALMTDEVTMVVEVDGRLRGRLQAHRGIEASEAGQLAVQLENVRRHLAGRLPHKVIYVPDRLINLVVSR